jgi:hypothetical protein
MLTGLETENGTAYIDLTHVVMIGPAVTKGSKDEARMVGLSSGGYVYMLNTHDNYLKLLPMLPSDAPALAYKPVAAKPKAKRAAKAKVTASPSPIAP